MSPFDPFIIVIFLPAGAALGAAYFALLRLSLPGSEGAGIAAVFLPLLLARVALAVGVFWIIAQQGALPLLIALLGFLLARIAAKRIVRVE